MTRSDGCFILDQAIGDRICLADLDEATAMNRFRSGKVTLVGGYPG